MTLYPPALDGMNFGQLIKEFHWFAFTTGLLFFLRITQPLSRHA
jgi:hypothetical protein